MFTFFQDCGKRGLSVRVLLQGHVQGFPGCKSHLVRQGPGLMVSQGCQKANHFDKHVRVARGQCHMEGKPIFRYESVRDTIFMGREMQNSWPVTWAFFWQSYGVMNRV